jgi:hypothetical protein
LVIVTTLVSEPALRVLISETLTGVLRVPRLRGGAGMSIEVLLIKMVIEECAYMALASIQSFAEGSQSLYCSAAAFASDSINSNS